MSVILKKIIFATTFNSCLFLLLLVGIQNSSNKSKVNFLINETVKLPISFIMEQVLLAVLYWEVFLTLT